MEWHRRGLMEFGEVICWHFQREFKDILFMTIDVERNRVVLRFDYQAPRRNLKKIELPIWLDWSKCGFGGNRVWFRCPGLPCGRSRVAVLYQAGGGFVCRKCCGLSYLSQRTSKSNRDLQAWKRERQKRRIYRKSLDGRYDYFELLPPPPGVSISRGKSEPPTPRTIEFSTKRPTDMPTKPSVRNEPRPDAPTTKRAEPKLNFVDTPSSKPSVQQAPKPDAPAAKRTEPTPNWARPTMNWNDVSPEKFKRGDELRPNPLFEQDREKRRALPVCAWCGDPIETDPVEIRGVDYHRECSKSARSAMFPTVRFD